MSEPTFRSALRRELVATALMLGPVLALSAIVLVSVLGADAMLSHHEDAELMSGCERRVD